MMNIRKWFTLGIAMLPLAAMAQVITGKYEMPRMLDWAKNAVFYQIYPQTFCDSDGDGIGDLQGIISKLDYVKSLGVDAIWFNPFFDSPFHDAGYDIRDYYKIAPRYGTNEDARQLFEEVHKRGMHVIFDYVVSLRVVVNQKVSTLRNIITGEQLKPAELNTGRGMSYRNRFMGYADGVTVFDLKLAAHSYVGLSY